ncbi:MAG: hypothetical protein ACREVX_09420 [Clostridium sp.]|uniref:hypothetical protein n=1 Tax=Clostridium sp. TaxID=1506 RepID=UPI003D6D7636
MMKKTGLIILSITAVLVTSATFATVVYNRGVSKVQKQIVENNILLEAEVKKVAKQKANDIKIANDKKIADDLKIANDKKIANKIANDKKIAIDKLASKKIADKKAADKIQAAKLNNGMTAKKALAMAYRLHPDLNFKASDGTELPKNNAYYEFKLFELNWEDAGADWYFVVNKKTGLAYKHYSDNSLVRDLEVIRSTKHKTTTINYTVNKDVFTKYNYPSGTTFQFKVGDTLKINATVINSTIRTMGEENDITFFTANEKGESCSIKMLKAGSTYLQIVPNYGDWDRAYIINIVVE